MKKVQAPQSFAPATTRSRPLAGAEPAQIVGAASPSGSCSSGAVRYRRSQAGASMSPHTPTYRWSLLIAALLPALASAATIPGSGSPVKPRVMVIFDTSRSMGELPQFVNPGDEDVF